MSRETNVFTARLWELEGPTNLDPDFPGHVRMGQCIESKQGEQGIDRRKGRDLERKHLA